MIESRCTALSFANGPLGFAPRAAIASTGAFAGALRAFAGALDCAAAELAETRAMAPSTVDARRRVMGRLRERKSLNIRASPRRRNLFGSSGFSARRANSRPRIRMRGASPRPAAAGIDRMRGVAEGAHRDLRREDVAAELRDAVRHRDGEPARLRQVELHGGALRRFKVEVRDGAGGLA